MRAIVARTRLQGLAFRFTDMSDTIELNDTKLPRIIHNLLCGECGYALRPVIGDYGVLYNHDGIPSTERPCPLAGQIFGLRDDLTVYKVR